MLLGVLADTHGKLPVAVHDAFAGVDHIIHAGDIGGPEILWELEAIAPVTAVLGNNDFDLPGRDLRPFAVVTLGGVKFLVGHILKQILRERDPAEDSVGVVVSGHTHVPVIESFAGMLHLNPGSTTRSRGTGHSVALVEVACGVASARIVPLP